MQGKSATGRQFARHWQIAHFVRSAISSTIEAGPSGNAIWDGPTHRPRTPLSETVLPHSSRLIPAKWCSELYYPGSSGTAHMVVLMLSQLRKLRNTTPPILPKKPFDLI